jgi:hypothetical protein
MASPAFTALPDARQAPYLDAFRRASARGELTPQQQRGVISNINNPAERTRFGTISRCRPARGGRHSWTT